MIFNDGMTIWILAILGLALAALAGWRQGGIRAAISLGGILLAALLAVPVGKLFALVLPFLGVTNPITLWAVAPICGFALVLALVKVGAQNVHKKIEVFYRYKAGDLRLTLWERVNSRLGICVGLLNGTAYFVLVSFVLFNLAYVTTQTSRGAGQPFVTSLVNHAGRDLQSTGVARTAAAVGTLPGMFYRLADTAGFLSQNPAAAQRLVEYPGLASLWERDEMLPLVQDNSLTNALASGASVSSVLNLPSVQDFLHNKKLSASVWQTVSNNFEDLTNYLATGKSPKFDNEKIIGRWEFNPAVTFAWMRQERARMSTKEVLALRAWVFQSYAQTRLLVTGDNQVFIRSLPRVRTGSGQQLPTTELNDWKGDWSNDGKNYTLRITFESEEKFLTGTTEGIRLNVKDGRSTYIFDKVE
jgi:uncharacterized membrane protein